MVVAGAGGISHAELVAHARELFAHVPADVPAGVAAVCSSNWGCF